jgi:hypothetical protein
VVLAGDPRFAVLVAERVSWLPNVAAYQPGRFFQRELPALRAVLDDVGELALVVIDGYVDLDPSGRAGLGAYLHAQIHVPVIGGRWWPGWPGRTGCRTRYAVSTHLPAAGTRHHHRPAASRRHPRPADRAQCPSRTDPPYHPDHST